MVGQHTSLLAQVRADARAWADCPRHHFPSRPEGYPLGVKIRCTHCEVQKGLVDIGNYIRGYRAAGGNPRDIMPDWEG